MFTKTIHVPKLVFDTDTLKVGQRVKYYKGECNFIDGKTIWDEEYECIIESINEDVMTLIDIESSGSCEGHEIFEVDAQDIDDEIFRKIELMED